MDKRKTASIALIVVLIACTIAIIAFVMGNGTTPVGPATPVPNLPTPTPNVISPFLGRTTFDRWGIPGWSVNTFATTPGLVNDVLYFSPIRVQYDQTWDRVAVGVNTSATNGTGRVCIYRASLPPYSATGMIPTTLVHDFGIFSATTTGTKTIVDSLSVNVTDSAGFYFAGVVARGDTAVAMRSPNAFDTVQAPISAIGPGAGGPLRQYALSSVPNTDYINVGCPADASGILDGLVDPSGYPSVWVRQNS